MKHYGHYEQNKEISKSQKVTMPQHGVLCNKQCFNHFFKNKIQAIPNLSN